MPVKKHLAHQGRYIIQALYSFSLPEWTRARSLRLALVGLVSALSIVYLIQTSQASVSGYQIRTLENSVDYLSREQQKLEVAVLERSSLAAIEKRMNALTLQKAQRVIHLDVSPSVARK